jgi:hypothetical protein
MRSRFYLIFATLLVMAVVGGDWQETAAAPTKTLVFEGTVTSIGIVDHELKPWLVTVKVRKIVSGEFSGSTFQFVVHSPARAGLEKGRSYTIEAVRKDDGYTVDENQWRRPKRLQTGTRPAVPAKGSSHNKCASSDRVNFSPAQRVGRSQPRAEAEGRCPGGRQGAPIVAA